MATSKQMTQFIFPQETCVASTTNAFMHMYFTQTLFSAFFVTLVHQIEKCAFNILRLSIILAFYFADYIGRQVHKVCSLLWGFKTPLARLCVGYTVIGIKIFNLLSFDLVLSSVIILVNYHSVIKTLQLDFLSGVLGLRF